MTEKSGRRAAVIAALSKLGEHVEDLDDNADVSTDGYNRWISMLDGVINENFSALKLNQESMEAATYIMHINAAIAFLENDD